MIERLKRIIKSLKFKLPNHIHKLEDCRVYISEHEDGALLTIFLPNKKWVAFHTSYLKSEIATKADSMTKSEAHITNKSESLTNQEVDK